MEDFPWYVPVGKFMLAFGDIEHSTISLLGCLPDCNIPKNAAKLTLGTRIDLLKEVLPRYPDPEYQEVLACLDSILTLSAKRNLIAHNAVWFDFYKDGDQIRITNHLVSARDRTKRLTLDEMIRLANEVETLARQFSNATVDVLKNYVDDPEGGYVDDLTGERE